MKLSRQLPQNVIGAPDVRVLRGDVATDERVELDAQGKVIGKRVGHVTGLRRYRAHRDISARQYAAGERLGMDAEISKRSQRVIADLGQPVRGNVDKHTALMRAMVERRTAEARVERAIKSLPRLLQSIATWVILTENPANDWAERIDGFKDRDGLTVLKVALEALADHYGMDSEGRTADERKKRFS